MTDCYDREGNPIDMLRWSVLVERGPTYMRVAQTTLANGLLVSTVWLGVNHQYGGGPPLIFETMVFLFCDSARALDCTRYTTEAQAQAGHVVMCEKWKHYKPQEVCSE